MPARATQGSLVMLIWKSGSYTRRPRAAVIFLFESYALSVEAYRAGLIGWKRTGEECLIQCWLLTVTGAWQREIMDREYLPYTHHIFKLERADKEPMEFRGNHRADYLD